MARSSNVHEGTSAEWETQVEPYPESWTPESKGESIQGIYRGSKEITQDGLDGNPRQVKIYTLKTENGNRGVWGSYNIDAAFENISEGAEVLITYEGKVPINNGAQTVKQFTVKSRRVSD